MSENLRLKENLHILPSEGMPYDKTKVPLINGTGVVIRDIVMGDQRDIAGIAGGGDTYKIYTAYLQKLLVQPANCDFDEFLLTDCLSLFYAVKWRSNGDLFCIDHRCENCGYRQNPELSMKNLMVLYASEFPNYTSEGLSYKLKGKEKDHDVTFHLPRLKDEKETSKSLAQLKKMGQARNDAVDTPLIKLSHLIDQIDGKSFPFMQKWEALLKLSTEDIADFVEFINECETGVLVDQFPVICSNCGTDNGPELNLGLSPDFFLDTYRRKQRSERKAAKVGNVQ